MSKSQVTTLDSGVKDQPTAEAATSAPGKPVVLGPEFSGKRMLVTIAAGSGDGEREAVFVSVHGVAFQIPRGKTESVPVEVVNVLNDAVITTFERHGKEMVPVNSPRHNFTALPDPNSPV